MLRSREFRATGALPSEYDRVHPSGKARTRTENGRVAIVRERRLHTVLGYNAISTTVGMVRI